jgi:hypothetical protein
LLAGHYRHPGEDVVVDGDDRQICRSGGEMLGNIVESGSGISRDANVYRSSVVLLVAAMER